MFTKLSSAAALGLDCVSITIEVDIAGSWPGYQIVGLGDTAIQEAKERIRTAWKNSGLKFPNNARIVINLAPANVRKEGSMYDLPMALGMYLAYEGIKMNALEKALFVGELALDGTVRHTNGILPIAIYATQHGFTELYIPQADAVEASIVHGITIYPVPSFRSLLDHLNGNKLLSPYTRSTEKKNNNKVYALDMAYVKGQTFVKRALEIAASGAHNILLSGPPGSGKTLLARTLPSILPDMTEEEAVEVTKIYSVAGMLPPETPLITTRPFRAPHHSASGVSLVGGGKFPRPGEISLSHRGVLFLDEFPEFPRHVLETLRQPLEDGIITISRAQGTITFPARFMMVASQNPCPCGYASDPDIHCTCSPVMINRYQKKISGPLLDRIDLHVEVPRVEFEKLSTDELAESSKKIQNRVTAARERQQFRLKNTPHRTNNDMTNRDIQQFCKLETDSVQLMREAVNRLHLSARSYHRMLKLARTIADLDSMEKIESQHIAEALQYRPKI